MNREDWSIDDYIKEIDRLHELEQWIDTDQFRALSFYIENEMKQKFSLHEREKWSLKF